MSPISVGLRRSIAVFSTSAGKLRAVRMEIATAMQKKVCPTTAWAVETAGGRKFSTVTPPRIPCTMMVAKAPMASFFIQARRSTANVKIVMPKVSRMCEAGQQAMTVFVENAANHARHVKRMKAGGPVGDGESGVIAGYEGSGDDDDEGRKRHEHRKL